MIDESMLYVTLNNVYDNIFIEQILLNIISHHETG